MIDMLKSKHILIAVAVIGLLGLVGLGASAVKAYDSNTVPGIVERLAETFNIDPGEVEDVFRQEREERSQNRLGTLIADGIITQEQADLIHETMDEFHERAEEIRDTYEDPEERHEAMEELHEERMEWREDNDLPMIGPMTGMGGRGMHGGPKLFGGEMGEGSHDGECPVGETE